MKAIKEFLIGLAPLLLEMLIGVLLLIDPLYFTEGIIVAVGVLLLLWGLVSCIRYFRQETDMAVASQDLFKGMVLLLAGGFCAMRSQWFIVTFPLLSLLYGLAVLLGSLSKVQWTVNLLRQKKERWFLAAIGALVSVICACVILVNPFSTTDVLWMFTGISLIVEALLDIATLVLGRKVKEEPEPPVRPSRKTT